MDAFLQALYAKTSNVQLLDWIADKVELCQPEAVHWCDGSPEEYDRICGLLVESGVAIPLNPEKRPNSYLCRTDPRDAERATERTFTCSRKKEDAGQNNHWCAPIEMKMTLKRLFRGCMRRRTLYVLPFSLGPVGAPLRQIGIQLTDSPYVVAHMHIMTSIGQTLLDELGDGAFIGVLHSVGRPLGDGEADVTWPCNPENIYVAHFPEAREVWSFGSAYGDNAVPAHKNLALRLAGAIGHEQGWQAEPMAVFSVTNPAGKKIYCAAAFSHQCDKTNLSMMMPALRGWKVECISDNVAWLQLGRDDRLHALNPLAGFCTLASGTNWDTCPNAMVTITANTLFTNVALTDDGDVWWEGLSAQPPAHLIDWTGQEWTPDCGRKAVHPEAYFTAPLVQCPVLDERWDEPRGVPISAILFGGKRSNVTPLVYEAYSWAHGVLVGASLAWESEAQIERDPFAALPFCGYNLTEYLGDWLRIGRLTHPDFLPHIFAVNWSRKDANGALLWPGCSDNIRVLKWVFERVCGASQEISGAPQEISTPIGNIPASGSIDTTGQVLAPHAMKQLLAIDTAEWMGEAAAIADYLAQLGAQVPPALFAQINALRERIAIAHMVPDDDETSTTALSKSRDFWL